MHPGDVLSLVVEISVAIAGFTGIVIVLGRRQSGEWSPVDRLRLRGLLNASFASLAMSGLALVLLASGVDAENVWAVCSAAYALLFLVFWTFGMRMAARLSSADKSPIQMQVVGWSGVVVIGLLIANVVVLQAFWPFASGLCYQVGLALFNFTFLLLRAIDANEV